MRQEKIEEAVRRVTSAMMLAYCEIFFEEWARQAQTLEVEVVQDWQKAIER